MSNSTLGLLNFKQARLSELNRLYAEYDLKFIVMLRRIALSTMCGNETVLLIILVCKPVDDLLSTIPRWL